MCGFYSHLHPSHCAGIPEHIHLQALQALMLLMPDENRVALETLLLLLREVADHCEDNQVTTPLTHQTGNEILAFFPHWYLTRQLCVFT